MIATLATKEMPKLNTGRGLEMRVFFSNGSGRQRLAVI
jgi:hypothetical protein